MAQEADALLGQDASSYVQVAQDSDADLPRGTTIRFVPDVEFNPPVREFSWQLPVHREEFLFRAARRLQGRVAHGLLSVYVGTVLIADVSLSIRVDSGSSESDPEPVPASRYRKIFASYSHLDAAIVENVGRVMAAIGDEFMRDVDTLRSGQIWSSQLEGYIRDCDVFQLYWSSNSMTSDLVSNEWHYALALNRTGVHPARLLGEAAARVSRAESPAPGAGSASLQLPAGASRTPHAGRAELSSTSVRTRARDCADSVARRFG
jgi:hypothetical protein